MGGLVGLNLLEEKGVRYNMEAKVSPGLQLPNWINPKKIARKPNSSLQFFQKYGEQQFYRVPASCNLLTKRGRFHGPVVLKVSCSSETSPASVLESGSYAASFDESKIIENKSEEIDPYLNGRCIYLVGMMDLEKTTVGKVLSEALGYSFCDCDMLIEEAVGGSTVAEIFKLHGENFFRDNETIAQVSLISTSVVWRYMQKGISVWLDVPLEALARRITAVGTNSRPLLHHESGDPYSKTMKRLTYLFEERGEAYTNADVKVSLEDIAAKLGLEDVCNLTPTVIALEARSTLGIGVNGQHGNLVGGGVPAGEEDWRGSLWLGEEKVACQGFGVGCVENREYSHMPYKITPGVVRLLKSKHDIVPPELKDSKKLTKS
ncbi:Shikimate kinase, chloroplastic [Sesamum angolense]|uniref:Shikimate kinase, chloroplastic n=1 Tax=Sesamum angolense TaxID=2727404 RepID=A0AAE2BQI9_9LAMI|nr:Shikimate kinase, chloroplastic [Sesamum angolense]